MRINTAPKYDKSAIMRRAHEMYKFYRAVPCPMQNTLVSYKGQEYTHKTAPFGYFLHWAWFCAKKDAERSEKEARERAERLTTRKQFNGGASFEGVWFKLWEKAGMRRIYLNGYKVNGAWINADSLEIHCKRDGTRALAERFLEQYIVA